MEDFISDSLITHTINFMVIKFIPNVSSSIPVERTELRSKIKSHDLGNYE